MRYAGIGMASIALLGTMAGNVRPALAQANKAAPAVYPVAVLAFQERGTGVKDYGAKIGDVVYAFLGTSDNLVLVDRQDIANTLKEQNLSLAGVVKPDGAARVGQLTGAKIVVTGSVFETGKTVYLTAKIIGTETTRVVSEVVKGSNTDDLGALGETLSRQIIARIDKDTDKLVAAPETANDIIADLNKSLGGAKRPAVTINIPERHIGQPAVDPAAATELALICKGAGFQVLETASGAKPAPLRITGEGFSELATRIGEMVSVKARLEVKVVDPETDKVIAVDRQTVIVVDLAEQIAGKSALQKAAAMIAERLLPQLAKR